MRIIPTSKVTDPSDSKPQREMQLEGQLARTRSRSENRGGTGLKEPAHASWNKLLAAAFILALLGAVGCRTARPLPPANLAEPGWTVRHGQAVWRLPQGKREIAGEILAATRDNGQAFMQFSKSPFTLVTAQATSNRWEIAFPPQNKHYSGRGTPPKRLIWLYLARVLSGQPPPEHWSWRPDPNNWRLANPANGESLEGYFEQ